MARNKINRLLAKDDKGVGSTFGPNGGLSRLFRQMLVDNSISPERFGRLMSDYLKNPKHKIPRNRKDMTSAQGNLGMALSLPQMTWKVFGKGLQFLKVLRIELTLKAFYESGAVKEHKTSITISEDYPIDDDEQMTVTGEAVGAHATNEGVDDDQQ
jgi:hypothetical protein